MEVLPHVGTAMEAETMHRIALVIVCLCLAGCSSNVEDAQPSDLSSESSTVAPSKALPTELAALPSLIRCEGFDDLTDEGALPKYVAEYGTCFMWSSTKPATLYRFETEKDMASFWDANKESGPTAQDAVTSGLIVVIPSEPSDVAIIKRDLARN